MHRPVYLAHSLFIEGSHTTKNTASAYFVKENKFMMLESASSAVTESNSGRCVRLPRRRHRARPRPSSCLPTTPEIQLTSTRWQTQTTTPTWCQCYKTFFPSSLMTRPNRLECLPFETLSSQVLEFEGKARANPIGGPFRCFLLG
jgi:hypothetical protein